jgi:isopentenyl-diphosphate Delta-isomerase
MSENVILVDATDHAVGQMEKMEAHLKGELHRALSVLIFNSRGEIMLQQRAFTKYHTPGLWSNTCCSHPRPGEESLPAASRRLIEEMGFSVPLTKAFDFVYRAGFDNHLIEHEFDHVYFGTFDGHPVINPEEAHAYRWVSPAQLLEEMQADATSFTVWFRIIVDKMLAHFPELFAR